MNYKKYTPALIAGGTIVIAAAREWLRLGAPSPALNVSPLSTLATAAGLTAAGMSTVKQAALEERNAELERKCAELRHLLRWTAGQVPDERRVGRWRLVEEEINGV